MTLVLAALVAAGCERPTTTTRPLHVLGVPHCPRGGPFARPLLLRVDRERALFEDAYTTEVTVDAVSTGRDATLPVARARMKVSLRVGLCGATSLGTWDCAAPTWLTAVPVLLDARAGAFDVTLPAGVEIPCADGALAR